MSGDGDTYADPAAEQIVLTAGLAQVTLHRVVAELHPDMFTTPAARLIHDALRAVVKSGQPVDHATVARRAVQLAETRHVGDRVQSAIMDMASRGGADLSVAFHLDRLASLRAARHGLLVAQRLQQRVEESVRLDDPTVLADGAASAIEGLAGLGESATAVSDSDLPMSLTDLLEKRFSHQWLIPDLIELTDRLVITGFEGTGKSYLVAQMVMAIAAGLHPFLGIPVAEQTQTLVIDAENSERQTSRRYRQIRAIIDKQCEKKDIAAPDWSKLVRFVIRPEGIALNDPMTIRQIERQVAATQPQFVAMGPLYRLHRLDTRDEQAAKELTDAIDRLRVKYQFAVVAEAHVAHGQAGAQRSLRPTGSSLFLRWPEFGLGLRPSRGTENEEHPSHVDLVAWRGGREQRMWPRQLQHSVNMPWGVADPEYYDSARGKSWYTT